jgi:hypothetical protein
MTPSAVASCPLLNMPPELRNDIYRYALLGPEFIVSNSFAEPSLLRTCKQIRTESLKLFYLETSFKFDIVDWNCRSLLHFKQQTRKLGLYFGVYMKLHGSPNWANLTHWVEVCRDTQGMTPNKPGAAAHGYFDSLEGLGNACLQVGCRVR